MYRYTLLPLIASTLVAPGTAVTNHVPQPFLDKFKACAGECEEFPYELEYNTNDTAYNWCSTYNFADKTACCIVNQCELPPAWVYDQFNTYCKGASPAVNITKTSCFDEATPTSATSTPSATSSSSSQSWYDGLFGDTDSSDSSDSSSDTTSLNSNSNSNDNSASDSNTGIGKTQDGGRITGIVVGSIGGFIALVAVIIFCIRRNGSGLPKVPATSTAWRIDEPRPAPVRRPGPSRAPVRSVARPPTPPPVYTAPPPAYRETV